MAQIGKLQKKLAASLLKVGKKRIKLDMEYKDEIKEGITKRDVKNLISIGAIEVRNKRGISKARVRKHKEQKRKGRRKGQGNRKGKQTARGENKKERWMNKIRAQRKLIKELLLKGRIEKNTYKEIYKKSKGGFFRSRRHIMIYLKDHNLLSESKIKTLPKTKKTNKKRNKSKKNKENKEDNKKEIKK